MPDDTTATPFNDDVAKNQGYLYTTRASLSSALANARLTRAALSATSFRDKKVLDVGCGDGTYSLEIFDQGRPASIHGLDFAAEAISLARSRSGTRAITYEVGDAESLPFASDSFDIAHLRGVLHHLRRPQKALAEAFRVARKVVVIEPNGYNPVLKVLEWVSPYHVKHNEKSYFPSTFRRWVREMGGEVRTPSFAGLVPFFCPDPMARALKVAEPAFEGIPLMRQLSCAVYVFVVHRKGAA